MKLPLYQIDAFTHQLFRGNPAAVCPLADWLPDEVLQSVAAENNLAETAFFVPRGDGYHLRWFTPEVEVALCGHATLASAWVIFEYLRPELESVRFDSRSGPLTVTRREGLLTLDFPRLPLREVETPPAELLPALGGEAREVVGSRDWLVRYETEAEVRALRPDMERLRRVEGLGVIATASGDDCDFVSRFFAPGAGIPEDPVTGSAHCTLVPYWAERLGKTRFHARQVSARGGELFCELAGERVLISGRAVRYLEGSIWVPD
ncbi:MAG: PhzF family phenazine biosynthesis protein [Armatimonadota bacterium]